MTNPLADAHKAGVVKGLKEFGVVPRKDIDVLLHESPDTFNLFLIALKELQEEEAFSSWKDKMSFYQIAGIHGLPHALWDNESGKKKPSDRSSGYCAHGTQTFPTWHRPYLAMLEQSLYKTMIDIADKYTDATQKATYKEAVKKFRLPYWDYYRPRDYDARFPGVTRSDGTTYYPYDFRAPQILTVRTVKVRMYPDGRPEEIPNPLSRYKFPDESTGFFSGLDWATTRFDPGAEERRQTLRHSFRNEQQFPDPSQALNAEVNSVREDSIRLSLSFMEDGAYNKYIDYATAGTVAENPLDGVRPSGSLEDIHGAYHGYIGSGGHMSAVETAAFDPIFWFHHCQIDRWFALWQAAHPKSGPDAWFATPTEAQKKRVGESWTTPSDPLLPFRHPEGQFWTSDRSYSTEAFGYTYPGMGSDPEKVQKDFKDLYSWARRLVNSSSNAAKPPASMEPLNLDESPIFDGIKDYTPLKKPSVALATFSAQTVMSLPELETVSFSLTTEAQPEAFAAKAEAVEIQAPISTAPDVKIPEEKVSREWFIDDVVQRLALNGSFTIFYFLGEFDKETPPEKLGLAPTFVGETHVFTAPIEACDNCGRQEEQATLVTSTTPFTAMLLDYEALGVLDSLRPEHVKPFLVKNLRWRVVGPDGKRVDPRMLSKSKDFKISISCKVAPLPGEEGQVVYEAYPDITDEIIGNAS